MMFEPDFGRLFTQIITECVPDFAGPVEPRACPDQYVGDVDYMGYQPAGADCFLRKRPKERPPGQAPIILVLESPHIDEYPIGESPGPAKGKTGINIRKYLARAVHSSNLTGRHSLILMNAIRYQCSLGKPTSMHREAIFRRMWKEKCVVDDFIRRLRDYTSGECRFQVMNACTAGNSAAKGYPKLRQLVEDTIRGTLDRSSDLRTYHPACWHWGIGDWN